MTRRLCQTVVNVVGYCRRTCGRIFRRRAKANSLSIALHENAPDWFVDRAFVEYAREPAFEEIGP